MPNGDCIYCDHKEIRCSIQQTAQGYYCTRKEGHRGPHIACGPMGCSAKVWPNGEDLHKFVMPEAENE